MGFMGQRSIAVALLVLFLGASALIAEARLHQSFSASSYYESDEKPAAAPKESADFSTDPNNRYPEGYPNEEHHYNRVTGKYDEETLPTTTSEKDTLPTETSTETTVQPSKNTTKDSTDTSTDPNNRYPEGYPNTEHHYNRVTGKYDEETLPTTTSEKTTDPLTFDPVKGRYSRGYHPYSAYTTNGIDSAAQSSKQQTTTPEGDLMHRYEKGYYPSSNGGVTLAAQSSNKQTTSLDGDFMHRYEKGYYPTSDYTQNGLANQPKSLASYSSYTGNFQSMPYPTSGVPFVAGGAGCRTAYWAENPNMWPSFFTVKSTVADAFGTQATSIYGQTTLLQALTKYGSDPYSQLLKCGFTALLNSYTRGLYPVSHMKVISQFNAALASPDAASAQALAFETDNVESISAGNACT